MLKMKIRGFRLQLNPIIERMTQKDFNRVFIMEVCNILYLIKELKEFKFTPYSEYGNEIYTRVDRKEEAEELSKIITVILLGDDYHSDDNRERKTLHNFIMSQFEIIVE